MPSSTSLPRVAWRSIGAFHNPMGPRGYFAAFTVGIAIITWVEPIPPMQALTGMCALICGIWCLRP